MTAGFDGEGDTSGEGCTLCGLATPDPPVCDDGVDGAFCCRGCLEVARALDDPEEAAVDDAREAIGDTRDVGSDARDVGSDAAENDGGDGADSADTTDAAETETAYLHVEGMHCTTCEAFLEGRAGTIDGVAAADATVAADAIRVQYDPARTDPTSISAAIDGVGYDVTPATAEDGGSDDDETAIGRLLVGAFFGMMAMVWYALFLYPTYFGLPPEALLFELRGTAGQFLLANVWLAATVVLGYTGAPLLRGAYVALSARKPNMDLLVALAATTAYLYSTVAILLGRVEVYFDVTIVVILAVTVGSYYEERVRDRALSELTELTERRVSSARVVTDDGTETVPIEDVEGGDRIEVRCGERVPVDGVVVDGAAAIDESLVTGEPLPVRRGPDDPVRGGTVVASGRLLVRADEGADRTLDRVLSLLWDVRSDGTPQRLADTLATVFVPVVLALGALAFAVHLLLGAPVTEALLTGLAVLVVSCPCALGLATPLAVAAGTRSLLADGVVLADSSAVETAEEVDVVALDKTGTLTTGEMALLDVVPGPETDSDQLLGRAAAIEAHSDHPVADAVVDAATTADTERSESDGSERSESDGNERSKSDRNERSESNGNERSESAVTDRLGSDVSVTEVDPVPGRGVSGRLAGGPRVTVGDASLFADFEIPESLRERYETAEAAGNLGIYVGWAGQVRGVLVAGDDPRPGWRAAVSALSEDRRVVILTGDDGPAVDRFRRATGVDEVYAALPPEGKTETVRRLREAGTVAMVGDGSNDAPALSAADLGIAVASGTELAADAADAVLVGRDLTAIDRALDTLVATRKRVRENLGWAFVYNAVAVPSAALGIVTPLIAAVAMAASSLLVVANTTRPLNPDTDRSSEGEEISARDRLIESGSSERLLGGNEGIRATDGGGRTVRKPE